MNTAQLHLIDDNDQYCYELGSNCCKCIPILNYHCHYYHHHKMNNEHVTGYDYLLVVGIQQCLSV